VETLARIRAGTLPLVAVAGTIAVLVAAGSLLLRGRPSQVLYELFLFHNAPLSILLLWLSWLVLRRRPGHGAGRLILTIGLFAALHVVVAALLDARLARAGFDLASEPVLNPIPAQLPLTTAVLVLLLSTVWVPVPVLAATLLLLVFPDGQLPGPRWRPLIVAALAGCTLLATGFAIAAWPTATWRLGEIPPVVRLLIVAGGVLVIVVAAAGVGALAQRWRRAPADQRWQFRLVGSLAVGFAAIATLTYPWQAVWIPAVLVTFHVLMIAYALAVARYRLYDLEPVLGRTAVGAVLALLVAGVYLAVVVGAGRLISQQVENALLPLVAVGVVALLVEPVRRRARRLVDRLLYGRRADRTEVLSRLAVRASTSDAAEEVLVEVAQLLVDSTGATRAEVWLAVAPTPTLAATAGAPATGVPALRTEVMHQREALGELCLYARASADLVPDAGQLLDDVAHSLGTVLRNARLTAQLRAQLEELRASRQRLVEVHDRARRELERDIHDGAQARLISLRIRLGLVWEMIGSGDRELVREHLAALGQEMDAAVRSLRELARGLHPPVLEQSGVVAALRAYVRELPVPIIVRAGGWRRYPQQVEGAVYFACLEAVQNAIRHGAAIRITVELAADAQRLWFVVHDDGLGFSSVEGGNGTGLSNIRDRLAALGGQVTVDSTPGHGTRIRGQLPVQPLVAER
jgi:two-component system, NarL family, sensor kinase